MTGIEQTLANAGVLGAVVLWFMLRSEKRTDNLTKALNNNNLLVVYLIETVANCPNNTTAASSMRDEQMARIKQEILGQQNAEG